MYNQIYDLELPTEVNLLFNCTSSTYFNLEIKNTGYNPFTNVTIEANFTPGGDWQQWLNSLPHFDPTASPQPMIKGLHGDNIYNLAPNQTGVISFDCTYIHQIKVSITGLGDVLLRGYGE
jgi:hypothetical protein